MVGTAQEPPARKDAAPVAIHLDRQPLKDAIAALARQTGAQLIYHPEDIDPHLMAPALSGSYTTERALAAILTSSGLKVYRVNDRTIALRTEAESTAPAGPEQKLPPKKSLASAATSQNGVRQRDVDEVVVTAQKREERLQDVPVPITAISGDTLAENNQLELQEYYTSVPGLDVSPSIQGGQFLTIRGVTTGGFINPTVAILIDDVPFGSSTQLGGAQIIPDLDPSDLARVEVLRGPQGTLYGASSLGGLVKFVTVDPSTAGFSGRVQAGVSSVYNGGQLGYNIRASVNLPVTDTFAVRVSGFSRQDPGYIDNPILHSDALNKTETYGAHLSGLWKPSEDFSVKLSALFQNMKDNGSNAIDVLPGLGDLQQDYLRGVGGTERKVQAFSAIVSTKLGRATLTSITGYNVNEEHDSLDLSYTLGSFTESIFGVTGSPVYTAARTSKFSQEIRALVPVGERFDWLFGAFYTHERSPAAQDSPAVDPSTGATVGQLGYETYPSAYTEYAAFTDLTVRFGERFDIQFGAREGHIEQGYSQTVVGPLFGAATPVSMSPLETTGNAFTYLVTPRLRIAPDIMVYARFASGYRAGGPNTLPGGIVPPKYNPDKTLDYEVGTKGNFFNKSLSIDASVYYIDWKDIQLSLTNPQNDQGYNANGGGAKSQGVELSIEERPLRSLTVSAWAAWNDAVLTQSFPQNSSLYGVSGDRLPYSSRFSGSLSLEQDFPLWGRSTGFLGGTLSYVGARQDVFTGTPQRQPLPAYAKTDLKAGVKYDSWTLNLFVNNLTDRRGVLDGGLGTFPPFAFYYIQPRTAGFSVARSF